MYVLLIVIGVLVIACAVTIYRENRARFVSWKQATGTVLEVVPREDESRSLYNHETGNINDPQTTYAPRLSFVTEAGEKIEFLSSVAWSPPPRIGDRIPLIYDPVNPHGAKINRFVFRHIVEIALLVLGVSSLVGGLIWWLLG